jgi:hypothetical protein
MTKLSEYYNFIQEKGKSLSEINPGSKEFALEVDDAMQAIELIKESQMPILGGDILSSKSGTLIYAYQSWGPQYHCLNWYCEKIEGESKMDFCIRSYYFAKEAIDIASKTAKRLGKKCYITLVV